MTNLELALAGTLLVIAPLAMYAAVYWAQRRRCRLREAARKLHGYGPWESTLEEPMNTEPADSYQPSDKIARF